MFIQVFPSGPFSTNAYIIACPTTKQAAIIDPAPNSASQLCSTLAENGLECTKILLTHSHWDHIADVKKMKEYTKAPISIHSLDVPNLENPGADGLPFWISIPGIQPDILLKEDDLISIGEHIFKVLHTPGHSPGSVCFYNAKDHLLFSGDTLFKGSIGNLSFPTSNPNHMWPSLDKLRALPPQTKVYPGHGPQTSIGAETWLARAKEMFS